MSPPLRVIVIGAGIGGTAFSARLAQISHVKITLCERDTSKNSRFQGLTIGVKQNAVNVLLKIMDPKKVSALFRKDSSTYLCLMNHKSNKPMLKAKVLTVKINEDVRSSLVDRVLLRNAMIDALPKTVEVNYSKKFVKYTETEQSVSAYFEDGTCIEGDVLVGADGSNSVVRSQRCPELEPVKMPYWTAAGTLPVTNEITQLMESNPIFLESKSSLLRKSGKRGASWLSFLDAAGPRILWTVSVPKSLAIEYDIHSDLEITDLKSKLELIANNLINSEAAAIINKTSDENMFRGYDFSSVMPVTLKSNPMAKQTFSRVTLLGDAAHKTTTQAGLGVNAALTDASLLAQRLGRPELSIVDSLRKYETIMTKNAVSVVKISVENTVRIHEANNTKVAIGNFFITLFGSILRIFQK